MLAQIEGIAFFQAGPLNNCVIMAVSAGAMVEKLSY
jgi:hypothetical protein